MRCALLSLLLVIVDGFHVGKPIASLVAPRRQLVKRYRRNGIDKNTDFAKFDDCGDDSPSSFERELYANSRFQRMHSEFNKTQAVGRRRPRFAGYFQAREWQYLNWGLGSREEWEDWVSRGEGKPSIIPSNPEVNYSETGDWYGWAHFLSQKIIPKERLKEESYSELSRRIADLNDDAS